VLLAIADQQERAHDLHASKRSNREPPLAELSQHLAMGRHGEQDSSRDSNASEHHHAWIKFAHCDLDE
jgi:hypothetical protein